MEQKNNLYFPNLNGLRFIAALMVIVHHIEQLKSMFGMHNYFHNPLVYRIGKLGVILFFVLSGFLITYLLLKEESEPKGISIKNFYIRRILRIWPLYFTVIGLALFLLPYIPFFDYPGYGIEVTHNSLFLKCLLFVFFFSNLVLAVFPFIPYASQAWSIGTEEQFYLMWPVLMKKVRNKYGLMFFIIGAYLAIKILILIGSRYSDLKELKSYWDMFCIDCMAIGGIMAVILFRREKILAVLFNRYIQIFALAVTLAMLLSGFYIRHLQYECYAVMFSVLIINLAGNPDSIFRIENSVFRYLGKISYGLYMYHPLAIIIAFNLLKMGNVNKDMLLYPLGIAFTVGLAAVSYRFLEEPFLKNKVNYSKIISGDNAR